MNNEQELKQKTTKQNPLNKKQNKNQKKSTHL